MNIASKPREREEEARRAGKGKDRGNGVRSKWLERCQQNEKKKRGEVEE